MSVASLGSYLTGCKLLKVTNCTGGCIKLAEVYRSIHDVIVTINSVIT